MKIVSKDQNDYLMSVIFNHWGSYFQSFLYYNLDTDVFCHICVEESCHNFSITGEAIFSLSCIYYIYLDTDVFCHICVEESCHDFSITGGNYFQSLLSILQSQYRFILPNAFSTHHVSFSAKSASFTVNLMRGRWRCWT